MDIPIENYNGLYVDPIFTTPAICQLKEMLNRYYDNHIIVDRKILESYANILEIKIENQTDEELALQIQNAAPCDWINSVFEWAKDHKEFAKPLNLYVTDKMMIILTNIRNNIPLNESDKQLLKDINNAIWNSPVTISPIKIYRGYRNCLINPVSIGNIITFNTPKSGSFDFNSVISGYVDLADMCIYEILIPTNSPVTYHPSEDQIIFPAGAQFYVLSNIEKREIENEIFNVTTIIYINAIYTEKGYIEDKNADIIDTSKKIYLDNNIIKLFKGNIDNKYRFPITISDINMENIIYKKKIDEKYKFDKTKLFLFKYKGIDWLVTKDYNMINYVMHNLPDMNDNLIFLKRVKKDNKQGAYIADIGLLTSSGLFYQLISPYFKKTFDDSDEDDLIEYLLNLGFYGVIGILDSQIIDRHRRMIFFTENTEKLKKLRNIQYQDYLEVIWPLIKQENPSITDKSMYLLDTLDDFNLLDKILPPMENI
jgi:hypothetical protein